MKKNVWIWNHYATNMFKDQAGRHYWFAEYLMKEGYKPTIFCASTDHFSGENIDTKGRRYARETLNSIPFLFINTPNYTRNDKKRIYNIFSFYRNLFPVAIDYAKLDEPPDVILASSVHPLTLVAGIKVAQKFGIPCICEVRDLWPESIVAYGILKRENPIVKLMYQGEKWIYKRADSIIMTWEGGKDYIINQGWSSEVDLSKITYISNGVDIASFDKNRQEYQVLDSDLQDSRFKNVVYAGSIRKVNNLGMLLDAAKIIQFKGHNDIRFVIYGSGDESERLQHRCESEHINNVIFKGRVEKKYIPSILSQAYVNILHNSSTLLDKYGQSQNKLFEYLAAGRCIVQTYRTNYSICERAKCGITAPLQNAEKIAEAVIQACRDVELNTLLSQNARKVAVEYDFKNLTKKLIKVIESVQTGKKI